MDGTTEKDCSPLWSLYQQIVTDMKSSSPLWEEFISKATKLHSALKSALVAIASFLDAFQKIADAATNARGATKDIGTALTRVCLRHRAIETRMKTFIGALTDALIAPLSERADEWRRAACSGALSREHARECKRARAELRRRVHDAQRSVRKARRATTDVKRRADVSMLDVQERRQQLEEMEERAVKAALVEERSRFCHFVTLLNPVLECEVAMLSEVGHLQEGSEQLLRHTAEPRTLPPASLQVICDTKSSTSSWCEASSPPASRLGSRKSSLASIASSQCDEPLGISSSTMSCSTPMSGASSSATLAHSDQHLSQNGRLPSVCSSDSGFRSQDALHRHLSLYADHGSDNQSVSSECAALANNSEGGGGLDAGSAASATWPDLKDTAQFERAASAIMAGRPHTISATYERGHQRPALSVHTFASQQEVCPRDGGIYARPPLPTRCSSLERPTVPAKNNANTGQSDMKPIKPSSLPPHVTKEIPQALYVNMSELATLAAARAQHHAAEQRPPQEKVCSESSASESSLESSSGYGSQGAFAAEDQALQYHIQHPEVECEVVTLRRSTDSAAVARDNFSISLGSLEEAVRSLDETCESPAFATIGKKPAVPKRRPASIAAAAWNTSRRGSNSSLGKPPPPVRRSSSISRPQRIYGPGSALSSPMSDADLPPPPAFLLQPDTDRDAAPQSSVLETVKQLNELRHTPASPRGARRLAPAQRGDRALYSDPKTPARYDSHRAPVEPTDARELSTFGPRDPHYGVTGFKLPDKFSPLADPSLSPLTARRRPHSADRRGSDQTSLIASLSAKLAPQLSPRTTRRVASGGPNADAKGIGSMSSPLQPAFLDKLSATLQHQQRRLDPPRAGAVRDLYNHRAQPDPRVCHTSLMEQIKRGATLKRNKQCNDRSAPKIR